MRQRGRLSQANILVWISIYIFALVIGFSLSWFFVCRSTNQLVSIAHGDAEHYVQTGEFHPNAIRLGTTAYIYNESGVLIDCLFTNSDPFFMKARLEKQITDAFNGEIRSVFRFIPQLDVKFAHCVCVTAEYEGERIVYVFIRDSSTMYTTTIVLFSALTPMFFLCIIFTWLLGRKDRRIAEMQREYVANISHDLKSPISSIKALSETMLDGVVQDEEKRRKYSSMILSEATSLENTVVSMLELSKIQSSQAALDKSPTEADEILAPLEEKYGVLCDELGINFHLSPKLRELPTLYTNAAAVSRVLDQLLGNATKFVAADGNIWLSAAVSSKAAVFSVRDDGVGISSADAKRIFERFYKIDISHNSKGSGLGLAIAQEIAQNLGEKLWVSSELGEGSCFYFSVHLK